MVPLKQLWGLVEDSKCVQNEGEIAACNYHAGMTPKQRIQVQNQWRSGALQVVVATIAFGMGGTPSTAHNGTAEPFRSHTLSVRPNQFP